MAGPFSFDEAEVLTFTQRGGESLKGAWYRINDSQKRTTKKKSTTIFLRNFYVGITYMNRFVLDSAINGNFIEAQVWEVLMLLKIFLEVSPLLVLRRTLL